MKKFLSILMVLTMILSLSVTVFAAENEGSITITNATVDETYALYKIFDASISKDADGNTNAVSYSIETDNQFFAALFGADGTTDKVSSVEFKRNCELDIFYNPYGQRVKANTKGIVISNGKKTINKKQ
jgi:hypothetical protein